MLLFVHSPFNRHGLHGNEWLYGVDSVQVEAGGSYAVAARRAVKTNLRDCPAEAERHRCFEEEMRRGMAEEGQYERWRARGPPSVRRKSCYVPRFLFSKVTCSIVICDLCSCSSQCKNETMCYYPGWDWLLGPDASSSLRWCDTVMGFTCSFFFVDTTREEAQKNFRVGCGKNSWYVCVLTTVQGLVLLQNHFVLGQRPDELEPERFGLPQRGHHGKQDSGGFLLRT